MKAGILMNKIDWQQRKGSQILTALEVLRKNGYECHFCSKQNGHIQVKSIRGVIYNFYSTAGTIVGYDYEETREIDELLKILKMRYMTDYARYD